MRTGVKALGPEFLWVVVGQLAAAVGLLATIRLLTTDLGPDEYGHVALALTISVFVNQMVAGPLTSAFVRFFSPAVEGGNLASYLAALRTLATRFVKWFAVVIAAVVLLALVTSSQWVVLSVPALIFSMLWSVEQSLDGLQNAARHRAVVAFHLGLGAWLKFGLAAVFFQLFGPSSTIALWAFVAATACVLTSQATFFRTEIQSLGASAQSSMGSQAWIDQMRAFSRPFVLWGLFHWAVVASDRYALGLFEGSSAVGVYNAAYQIGYYPVTLLSAVGLQLLVPVLYSMAGDASDIRRLQRTRSHTTRIAYAFAATSVSAAALMTVVREPLFRVLVGERFQEASSYVAFLLLAGGLFAAGQIAAQRPLLEMNARGLLAPKLITAAIGIALNFAGALLFGIAGVVGAGVIFSTAYFLWMVLLPGSRSLLSVAPRTDVEPVGQELAGPAVDPAQSPKEP